jgi:lipopolysaccharide export system protein LptA
MNPLKNTLPLLGQLVILSKKRKSTMKTGIINKSAIISGCAVLALLVAGMQGMAEQKTSADETVLTAGKVIMKKGKSVLTADKIKITKESAKKRELILVKVLGQEVQGKNIEFKKSAMTISDGKKNSVLTADKITVNGFSPKVITTSGGTATVRLVSQVADKVNQPTDLGITMKITPTLKDDKILLQCKLSITTLAENEAQKNNSESTWFCTQTMDASISATVKPNTPSEPLLVKCNDKMLKITLEACQVDQNGKPI